jgi:hypothetical protein
MADLELQELLGRQGERVRAVLNILVESPYFYRTDDEELFAFLLRYRREFTHFFKLFYDWELIHDAKCARVFKRKWYNEAISEGKREWFRFSKRDECLAFMLLLEFFEGQLEEQNVSVEDRENLRFYLGDLLRFTHQRLTVLYPEAAEAYTLEAVRKILRAVMPQLERFRLLEKVKPEAGERPGEEQLIYEALPALYHYNTTRLSYPVFRDLADGEEETRDAD